MKRTIILSLASLFIAGALTGCAASTEYEVTGTVSSAATVNGPIRLEFFEQDAADEAAERVSIHQVELAAPGAFTETIEVTDDYKVIAFALADENGDGLCTEGELWDEQELTPNADGTLPEVTLALAASPCPAATP